MEAVKRGKTPSPAPPAAFHITLPSLMTMKKIPEGRVLLIIDGFQELALSV